MVFERVATMQKKKFFREKMILAAVGAISLITLASWIWRSANTLLPNELIGEWHTSNAIYSDRYFGIGPVSIRFGTGAGTVTTGFIKKVSAVQQGARTLSDALRERAKPADRKPHHEANDPAWLDFLRSPNR